MYQSNNVNGGFTLIEIIISMAILGVVTSTVLVVINPGRRLAQGRDTKRIADVKQIGNILKAYYTANSVYPEATCTYNGWERSEMAGNEGDCTGEKSNFMEYLIGEKWLKTVPVDPLHNKNNPLWGYLYRLSDDRQSFCLLAHLENEDDPILTDDANALMKLGGVAKYCDNSFEIDGESAESWWYAISSERK